MLTFTFSCKPKSQKQKTNVLKFLLDFFSSSFSFFNKHRSQSGKQRLPIHSDAVDPGHASLRLFCCLKFSLQPIFIARIHFFTFCSHREKMPFVHSFIHSFIQTLNSKDNSTTTKVFMRHWSVAGLVRS